MSAQHSVIAHWKAICEKAGAAVYSGGNFLHARWEDGRRISLRVDKEVEGTSLPRGAVIELKQPVDALNSGLFIYREADASTAIIQIAGEDDDGDVCATGEAIAINRGQLKLFERTGIVIELE